jgi:TonB family protein
MKTRSASLAFFALLLLAVAPSAWAQNSATSNSTSDQAKRQVKSKTDPAYPALAREMHVKGKVKVELTVAPDGSVHSTKVLGGSPLLAQAAVDAVKSWKYETGAHETTETVEFVFSQ